MTTHRWWPMLLVVLAAGCDRAPDPSPAVPSTSLIGTDSLIAPGQAHYWLGRYDSARHIWGGALEDATTRGDSADAASLLTWLGLAAMRTGDYGTARAEGEMALRMKLALNGSRELARSYNALGLLAEREDRLLEALALYEQAITAAEQVDDARQAATAAGNLGLIHAYLGDLDRAATLLDRMRHGARSVGEPRLEANALTNLGMVAIWSGDPESALGTIAEARRLYGEVDSPLGEQHALAQLSTALADMGRYREAMATLDTAVVLARHHDMKDQEAENLRLLGSMFADLGDNRRALRHYEEATTIAQSLGSDAEMGTISRLAAAAHLAMGADASALADAEAALAAHSASGEPFEELDDLLVIAHIRQRMSDSAGEREALRSAGFLARRLDTRSAHTAVALADARQAEAAGNHRQVLAAVARARATSVDADFRARAEIHGFAARAYTGLTRLDSASIEGLAAVGALDRVRDGLRSSDLRGSFAASSAQLYGDVVLLLLEQGREDEAFAVADGARSGELLRRLTAGPTGGARGSDDGEALLRRIDALLAQLGDLESVPPDERGSGAVATTGELLRRIERVRDEYERYLIRVAQAGPDSPGGGGGAATRAGVRAALAPDEALLHYTLTGDELVLFVGRADRFESVRVPVGAADIGTRIRLLRGLLGTREAAPARGIPAAHALYDLLVAPAVETGLLDGADRLLVVPHGIMEQLPFAVLRDPDTGRFLVQDHVIAYLPSASVISEFGGGRGSRRATRGTTAFAPFPLELPGTDEEASAAAGSGPGSRVRRGSHATEAAVRSALAASAVVHIASHGVLNARNPAFSRINLTRGAGGSSDDGRLEVHEVLHLDVQSDLVILSGCETALAEEWSGDPLRPSGVASLAQAFLQAGSNNVVATLWRIDDIGSAALVSRLYALNATHDVAGALAHAQREMIRHPRYAAPYYWAGYTAAGNGRSDASAQTIAPLSVQ